MLSPLQSKLFSQIATTVPVLPTVLVSIISDYQNDEELIALALKPIKIQIESGFGIKRSRLDSDDENEKICAMIYCLSSSDCDPEIKSRIIRTVLTGTVVEIRHLKMKHNSVDVEFDTTFEYGSRTVLDDLFDNMRSKSITINLDNVDLRDLDLNHFNFDSITARNACFKNSILRGASFRSADLFAADLSYADMHGAILQSATLCRANLSGTNLSCTNMRFANVSGAKFDTTIISESYNESTDLTGLITSDISLERFLGRFREYSPNATIVSGKVHLTSVKKEKNVSACIIS